MFFSFNIFLLFKSCTCDHMATVPSSVLEGRWKNVSLSQAAALCSLTCCWLCVVWDFCLLGFCLVVTLCLKTSWFTKQNLGDKLQFNSCVSLQLFTFQSLSAVHIVRVLHSLFCRFHYNIFLIIFLITSHTVFFSFSFPKYHTKLYRVSVNTIC